jgi:hypothetical protein
MGVLPLVRLELEERFASEEVPRLLAELDALDLRSYRDERRRAEQDARIHLGILKYADGDIDRFRHALRTAREDWRDLLMMAGLAHPDWRDELTRAGFRVPPE